MRARAKINLYLDVLSKREDSYHELSTIMQSLAIYDGIYIKKIYKPNYLKLVSNLSWLPCDERNLVHQAASYMIKRFDVKEGIFIELKKMIPASAGLGGGSADCAATLVGIRNLFNLPIKDSELVEIGARFGADVPFCLMRGCCLATGIGEKLQRLPSMPHAYVLLVRPPVAVSTPEVFRDFSIDNKSRPTDLDELIKSIGDKNLKGVTNNLYNALEENVCKKYPIISAVKAKLIKHGAAGALMSGSGPTVFGIFERRNAGFAAMHSIKSAYPEFSEVFLTTFYNV